jgi:hypothetical protein
MSTGTTDQGAPGTIEQRARRQLKKKRDLATHALVYVMVNALVVVIWATTSDGFFWPVFLMAGWGIGLVLNAWEVWHPEEFTDEQVAREVERIRRREGSAGESSSTAHGRT